MKKRYAWPQGHWDWPVHVSHKHGVRCGQIIWIGGQVDITESGEVLNSGNLKLQTVNALASFERVLKELDCGFPDLVKLLCFYVDDGTVGEQAFLEMVAAALPEDARPAITVVPVPYLSYPGMVVEIEGYAMRGTDDAALPRTYVSGDGLSPLPGHFANAVRCGKMIFVSGQTAVDGDGLVSPGDIVAQTKQAMKQIGLALERFGASFDDVVKHNRWYVGKDTLEDFEPGALAAANFYSEPGPAATGIPLPSFPRKGQMIKIEVVAMLNEDGRRLPRRHAWPDSLWDWTIKLPYQHGVKCHDMIFLGGQVSIDKQGRAVNPDNMKAQTHQAMTHIGTILRDLGADYSDVCKITTMYEGQCGYDELHENLLIRSSYFTEPGPATTGVSLPLLSYPGMIIEIDAFAMSEPDPH